jgi:hypothetical protein
MVPWYSPTNDSSRGQATPSDLGPLPNVGIAVMRRCYLFAYAALGASVLILTPSQASAQFGFFRDLEAILGDAPAPIELKFKKGRVDYAGMMEEVPEVKVRGKKSYKIFLVKLERGKSYQLYMHSKVFQSFLYLEDADGKLLKENSSPTIGGESRLVFKAEKAGLYRIIATSLGGFRTGPFVSNIRDVNPDLLNADLPKDLASWFDELDMNRDGQVALYEWREGGKELDGFGEYDLNDDGFITIEELVRYARNQRKAKK